MDWMYNDGCVLYSSPRKKAGGNFTGDPFMAVIAGFLVICAVYVFTFPKFKADQIAFFRFWPDLCAGIDDAFISGAGIARRSVHYSFGIFKCLGK